MGSSASRNVKSVSIRPVSSEPNAHAGPEPKSKTKSAKNGNSVDDDEQTVRQSSSSLASEDRTRLRGNRKRNKETKDDSAEVKSLVADDEAKLQMLQSQLEEAHSHNLELQDQIQLLEQRLELMEESGGTASWSRAKSAKTSDGADDGCMETIKAKDQYIDKLEEETKAVQQAIAKLRLRYKKKLRSVNAKLAESKQENSLQLMELKDEMTRLGEENSRLAQGHDALKPPAAAAAAAAQNTEDDSRTRIILDLSSKVSEQDDRIIQLELKLREKDKVIEELQHECRGQSSRTFPTTDTGGASNGVSGVKQPAWGDSDNETAAAELQQIQQEMRKLRASKQQKKKTKHGSEASKFQRSSATSRDSGIVPHTEEDVKQVSLSNTSPYSGKTLFSEDDFDDGWDNAREFGSGHEGLPESSQASLDPASIRQISAAKNRRRTQKSVSNKPTAATTLPVLSKPHDAALNDADTLLKSIDDDVYSFPTVSSKSGLPEVFVQS